MMRLGRIWSRAAFGALAGLSGALEVLPAPASGQDTPGVTAISLALNVPAFRLDVYADSALLTSFPVAVGLRRYATPLGQFRVTQITWNPWWFPPESEWAREDTTLPPGPANPMGKVKLQFGERLFLHGTPLASTVGRAASHGCIRLHDRDAIELARLIQSYAAVPIGPSGLDSLIAAWSPTHVVDLPMGVRFEIAYELAEVRDSALSVYPDVYRRGREDLAGVVLRALHTAGYDTTRADGAAVGRIIRRARSRPVRVPVDSVVIPIAENRRQTARNSPMERGVPGSYAHQYAALPAGGRSDEGP
jgi:hypothetical protein